MTTGIARVTIASIAASIAMATLHMHAPRAMQPPAAALTGVVVTADAAPVPVRRAIVSLTGDGIVTNVSAITDELGRFEFRSLRPGRYAVTASKPAFLTAAYGARQIGRAGTPVTIAAGAPAPDLRIAIARGAVIGGMVRDMAGDPAPGVSITVARADDASGLSRSTDRVSSAIVTDDRGVYRAYGLEPGEYVVAATPRLSGPSALDRLTSADVEDTLRTLQQSGPRKAAESPRPGSPRVYAPVYFPGTPVAADATRIRLGIGDVREDLDFAIDPVATATIAGRVTMADGTPVPSNVFVNLTATGPALPVLAGLSFSAKPGADGTFSVSGVTPGRYVAFARTPNPPPPVVPAGQAPPPPPGSRLWAMAEVSVSGSDVEGVALTMRRALTFGGRVEFEATTQRPPPPTGIKVELTQPVWAGADVININSAPMAGVPRPWPAYTRPDGSFQAGGLMPGRYVVVATLPEASAGTGWWLKSATVNGRDVLDFPVEMRDADILNAVLTFSDRRSTLDGTLQSGQGQPATDYVVVVFPADRALWQPGARRLQAVRPAQDGRFLFSNLPPGEYVIGTLAGADAGSWQDRTSLEQLLAAGVKVTVTAGATATQNLRIGG